MEIVSEEIQEARNKAQSSSVMGIFALMLCLFGCCSYNATALAAVPLAIFAIHQARVATAMSADDEYVHVVGRYGQIMGLISLCYALLMLSLFIGVVLMYVAFLVLAIVSA